VAALIASSTTSVITNAVSLNPGGHHESEKFFRWQPRRRLLHRFVDAHAECSQCSGRPEGREAGRTRKFPTFAPLAVAAIGLMPLPLLHRAVVINMQRASGQTLTRLDENSAVFPAARAEFHKWAQTCTLASNPVMPTSLRNRAADNWRVLLAIADDLGYGEETRAAAGALNANRPDEDAGVLALTDIRSIFDRLGADRSTSKALTDELVALDDGMWGDWRGPNDDRPPRKLNQSELSRLLKPFSIRPRTIRLASGGPTARGYLRVWFEAAWAAYCPPAADTPTQASKIIHLAHTGTDT
jgi:hypothetical protein